MDACGGGGGGTVATEDAPFDITPGTASDGCGGGGGGGDACGGGGGVEARRYWANRG